MLTQDGLGKGIIRAAALPALLLAGFLTGCGGMNDDPADGMSVVVSFDGQDQGALTNGAIASPSVASTDPILTIIVGALVITHDRDPSTAGLDPYTGAEQVTPELKEKLKDDAIQSAAYLTIEDLPFSGNAISFLIPPAGAGSWQLVGVGTRVNIDVLQDLEDNENAPIWYGFFAEFQNGKVTPGQTVDLTLSPGCNLSSPPAAPACP